MRKNYSFYKNEPVESIVEIIERSDRLYGNATAFKYKVKKQKYEKNYRELHLDCCICAKNLLLNYSKSQHVAVLGASSYEWIVTYLGTVFAGRVIVPLDKELTEAELIEQITKADVNCLFYDDEYLDVAKIIEKQTSIKIAHMSQLLLPCKNNIMLPGIEPDKMSAILFTSGTTGKSKGVMLTQRNIANNVRQGMSALNARHNQDVILSVLPLNHAYEFTGTILGMIYKGVTICISSGLKYLQKELKEYQPTLMFVVPLIVEKLYEKVESAIKDNNKEKQYKLISKVTYFLYQHGIDISHLFFKKITNTFGGRLKRLMCGGAPLQTSMIRKYNVLGINLFQGYGLTECSPCLAANIDRYQRIGSVGKIVDQCELKTVDGEIWAKGISVSVGYYNNPTETEKAFYNGWFKTGDLGYVDEDGFVFLTGRKKNLIILDNGKNVSAEELEDYICQIPYISEAIVYGKNNLIVAEIYIDSTKFTIPAEQVEADIDEINSKLPAYKNINNFCIRSTPFEKTTTKKIKRTR